jgi:prephenate dehydrogenase
VLTDVGGAKEALVRRAAADVRPGVAFVGAHPMFGGHGGYAGGAAAAARWKGGAVAVCTDGPPEAIERVAALHAALGATVIRCTAAEHDAAVAMVSHLPYLVASALSAAAAEAGPLARALAGRGLEDTTRLAAFPFDIQGEVARRNAHLPAAAASLQAHLADLLAAIAASPEAARGALETARRAREELF